MDTVTEARESRANGVSKRPLGNLQAKIDGDLFDRLRLLATRRTVVEQRQVHPRDLVEEALEQYLPKAEKKLDAHDARRG